MSDARSFQDIERLIVHYFETAGCDVEQDRLEWFLSLYDEGPAISLTSLALALTQSTSSCLCGSGDEPCPGPDGKPLCAHPPAQRGTDA